MKLIVGLGNIGKRYENDRHNMGFVVIDALVSKISEPEFQNYKQRQNTKLKTRNKFDSKIFEFDGLILIKPQTMMNSSGKAVSQVANYYKIEGDQIYVIYDDLDIRLGEYKIQKGKGPKDHKGLLSIYEELGREDFWHIRIGIDNRDLNNRVPGEDYVLMIFSDEELRVIQNVMEKVISELLSLI